MLVDSPQLLGTIVPKIQKVNTLSELIVKEGALGYLILTDGANEPGLYFRQNGVWTNISDDTVVTDPEGYKYYTVDNVGYALEYKPYQEYEYVLVAKRLLSLGSEVSSVDSQLNSSQYIPANVWQHVRDLFPEYKLILSNTDTPATATKLFRTVALPGPLPHKLANGGRPDSLAANTLIHAEDVGSNYTGSDYSGIGNNNLPNATYNYGTYILFDYLLGTGINTSNGFNPMYIWVKVGVNPNTTLGVLDPASEVYTPIALSNGNKTVTSSSSTTTAGISSEGKLVGDTGIYYTEFLVNANGTRTYIGMTPDTGVNTADKVPGSTADEVAFHYTGAIYRNNVSIGTGPAFAAGQRRGFVYNSNTGEVWMHVNGVYVESGDPVNMLNPITTMDKSISYEMTIAVRLNSTVTCVFDPNDWVYAPTISGIKALPKYIDV